MIAARSSGGSASGYRCQNPAWAGVHPAAVRDPVDREGHVELAARVVGAVTAERLGALQVSVECGTSPAVAGWAGEDHLAPSDRVRRDVLTGEELRLEVGEREHGSAERACVALRRELWPKLRENVGASEEPPARLAQLGRSVIGGRSHGVNATRRVSRGSRRVGDSERALGSRLGVE
jgi:hypothetical protein